MQRGAWYGNGARWTMRERLTVVSKAKIIFGRTKISRAGLVQLRSRYTAGDIKHSGRKS